MKTPRTKSRSCGPRKPLLAILLLIALLLAFCGCNPSRQASKQIYQPPVLILPAGKPVETAEGTYTPQTVEVWHSAARYRQLELMAIDAAAALAQERAKGK
jgi:hypothetical protein